MAGDILTQEASPCRDMKLSGWGRFPEVTARVCRCGDRPALAACLKEGGAWIPFGLGRSYGDSALGSRVMLMSDLAREIEIDGHTGRLICQAGVSLARLLAMLVPRGWFLPVVPGTRQVTVGGAIASDVHGKNHHQDGSFSNYVSSLSLMMPDGEVVVCSPRSNPDLFRATCGGMGLTGVILSAEIRLKRIDSSLIRGEVMACRDLDELLAGFENFSDWPYLVAWIDGTAVDDTRGRFLLMAGRHDSAGGWSYRARPVLTVPSWCPGFIVNRVTIRMFNTFYYRLRRQFKNRFVSAIDPFFFPLDRLADWNRLYGKRGLLQYQLVLPERAGRQGLRTIFQEISGSSLTPALAVLKLLGPGNDNFLSFPRQGYTLALDYKLSPGLFSFFKRLDCIVQEHGGRIYLAKDARMPAALMSAGYPGLNKFAHVRDQYRLRQTFQSRQSRRLDI
ncbi:MAG: FAD-binding protein [Desulfosudaceae bacterium]